jgi:hypothetical protein
MSDTTLSDYDPDEYSPQPDPVFCCSSVQQTSSPARLTVPSLPPYLSDLLFSQKDKQLVVDNPSIPLSGDTYDTAVASIVQTSGSTMRQGTRWIAAPIAREEAGTMVLVPKHKVYAAQEHRQLSRRFIPGSFTFGNCPNHPDVEFQAKWCMFINGSDLKSEDLDSDTGELVNMFGNGSDLGFEDQDHDIKEDDSDTKARDGNMRPLSSTQSAQSRSRSQAQMEQLDKAAEDIDTDDEEDTYEHLQRKVRPGRGLPCDQCAPQRRTCSRRMRPGGPPRCELCEKKDIACTWARFVTTG